MSSFEFCFIYLNVSFGGRGASGVGSLGKKGGGKQEAEAEPGCLRGAQSGCTVWGWWRVQQPGCGAAGVTTGNPSSGPNQLILINCQQ